MSGYHPSLPIPRNPWNLERSTSGSSSGPGVATAAGLCFASLGTDTGGSIRGPSSWCGVVGLKPTFCRVSRYGVFPLSTSLDHVGPMTRTVADAAAVLGVIAGADPRDPTALRAPVPDYRAGLDHGVRGLRIGIDEAYAGNALPEMGDAVARVGDVLQGLGAILVRVALPDVDDACRAWAPICAPEAVAAHAAHYPARAADYGRSFRSLLDLGARMCAAEYAAAQAQRLDFAGRLGGLFEQIDVFLCPGNFSPPPQADLLPPDMEFSLDFWPFMRFSAPFNLSGSPTLSLPCGFTADGLPLGVQLVGRHLEEATLCRVGQAYEQASDWRTRHPVGLD
jgi:amidase